MLHAIVHILVCIRHTSTRPHRKGAKDMEEKQTAQGTATPASPVPKPDVDDLIFTGQISHISDR